MNEGISEKKLKDYYEKRYEEAIYKDRPKSVFLPLEDYFGHLHDKIVHKQIGKGNIALDLGCGTGHYLKHLKNGYRAVIGLEYSENALRNAMEKNKKVLFVLGDAQCLPFKEGVFDFVLSSEVIEHLLYPENIYLKLAGFCAQMGNCL